MTLFKYLLPLLLLFACSRTGELANRLPAVDVVEVTNGPEVPDEMERARFSYQQEGKIVVFGDVHADPESLIDALVHQGVLNSEGKFIGENMEIIFMGDYADKGPNTLGVWDVIEHVTRKAKEGNSRVHSLMGNHDSVILMENLKRMKVEDLERFSVFDSNPETGLRRALTSEPYRSLMQQWKSMVKVGDYIFVHGGLDEWVMEADPDKMNFELQQFVKL